MTNELIKVIVGLVLIIVGLLCFKYLLVITLALVPFLLAFKVIMFFAGVGTKINKVITK